MIITITIIIIIITLQLYIITESKKECYVLNCIVLTKIYATGKIKRPTKLDFLILKWKWPPIRFHCQSPHALIIYYGN